MARIKRSGRFDLYRAEIEAVRPDLAAGEPERLAVAAQGGDATARDLLVRYNLPMVIKAAKRYYKSGNYDFDDVVAEGVLGVIKAIDHFNLAYRCKFSTYAWWCVRGEMQTFICKNRFPVVVNRTYQQLVARWQTAAVAEGVEGGPVNLRRVAARAEIGEANVATVLLALRAMTAARCPVDTDGVGVDRDAVGDVTFTLADDVPDGHAGGGADEEKAQRLREALGRLAHGDWRDERRLSILSARFGLGGRMPMTLREVAASLDKKICYERVRQIEKDTLDWLRTAIGASDGTKD